MSVYDHLVFAVHFLPLDGISGVELRVFARQTQQHGSFQVHPQLGVQVFLLRLTDDGCLLTNAVGVNFTTGVKEGTSLTFRM